MVVPIQPEEPAKQKPELKMAPARPVKTEVKKPEPKKKHNAGKKKKGLYD